MLIKYTPQGNCLSQKLLVLLHLRTFFKNFVCAQFSFARRNVYHLRTVLVLHLRAWFCTSSLASCWHFISTVTPVHRPLKWKCSTKMEAVCCFVHWAPSRTACLYTFSNFNSHIHHRLCLECHLSDELV